MPPQHRTPVALPVTLPDALVVDADEDIRLALRTLLEDAGCRVSDATTWQEARRYLRSHPARS
jgi:CheY-like chemotaxis protein